VRSVDSSLDRLGIDVIDLYFVHGWDQHTPVTETLDTLAGLVRSGKIHSIGWSNVTGWQLAQILAEARHGGLISPCVVQPQYNLLDRGIELDQLRDNLATTTIDLTTIDLTTIDLTTIDLTELTTASAPGLAPYLVVAPELQHFQKVDEAATIMAGVGRLQCGWPTRSSIWPNGVDLRKRIR